LVFSRKPVRFQELAEKKVAALAAHWPIIFSAADFVGKNSASVALA